MVTWGDIRREPFRILFPIGMGFGLLGIGHWLAYSAGWIPAYSGFYHSFIQAGLFMSCFIAGFLLTAIPRFSSTAHATTAELIVILLLLASELIFSSWGLWIVAEVCFGGLLVALFLFIGRRFASRPPTPEKSSGTAPPTEFVWIPIALLHGILGTTLLVLGQTGVLPGWSALAGRPMAQQGFLLSIVLGVGGFMAPRLMGRVAPLVVPAGLSKEEARRLRMRRVKFHLAAGAILLMSFCLEGAQMIRPAYLLRAVVVTAELVWTTRLYRLPIVGDLYVRFVWVSLWMMIAGLWGSGFMPGYRVAMLHLVFIGGFSLMIFAVATMVVLSHSGEGERLRGRLWELRLIGPCVVGSLAARLLADFVPNYYFPLLGVSSALWIMAGMTWLGLVVPRVLRPVPRGAFERLHEEAKQKILRTQG